MGAAQPRDWSTPTAVTCVLRGGGRRSAAATRTATAPGSSATALAEARPGTVAAAIREPLEGSAADPGAPSHVGRPPQPRPTVRRGHRSAGRCPNLPLT